MGVSPADPENRYDVFIDNKVGQYYESQLFTQKQKEKANNLPPAPGIWQREPLSDKIQEIARGSFKQKEPPEIIGSGYVVQSLEAALWAFYRSETFEEGCLLAANLGNDADTTGTIFGQLAGAFYGLSGIPDEWRGCIAHLDLITSLTNDLFTTRA